MKEYAIIVAGGKGTRIKSTVPKQFIQLNGRPVLMHTLDAFYRYSSAITVILVLPREDFGTWNELCRQFHFTHPVILQTGGTTRFQSVKNGLEKIDEDGLVAVHDGVRPLVSEDIIRKSFALAKIQGSAVASVLLKDSIRIVESQPGKSDQPESTKAVERSKFRLIQTPQTFAASILRKAYIQKEDSSLTDDASVVERSGVEITLFEGSYDNIKVTTSEDLIIAEALLKKKS